MHVELWNAIAAWGTFLVIAATAIAALIQLRHMRVGNQITILNELRETYETPHFQETLAFIYADLQELLEQPQFRYEVTHREVRSKENHMNIERANSVGNFYDILGLYIREGYVDKTIAVELWAKVVVSAWRALEPLKALYRRSGRMTGWENFEWLTVLSQDWLSTHRDGRYDKRYRRLTVVDKWQEADNDYKPLAP